MAKKSRETQASESPKLCQCRREVRHFGSMNLMLMEAQGDQRKEGIEFYKRAVQDAVKKVGECAKVDMGSVISDIDKVDKYTPLGPEGTRPIMRVLQDSYWKTLHNVCAPKAKRV